MGKRFATGESLVMKSDGFVVRVRAVRERTATLELKDFDILKSTPHDPLGTLQEASSIPRPSAMEEEAAREEELLGREAPKRVPITREAVRQWGGTVGCKQCAAIESGRPYNDKKLHTEECRRRMEKLMRTDVRFAPRLEAQEMKRTRYFADFLEARAAQQELD